MATPAPKRPRRNAKRAMGLSVHTGWAACVVVSGSPKKPEVVANVIVDMLDDSERFCFHMAEQMKLDEAEKWIARARKKATANAKQALASLMDGVSACAIVAKTGSVGSLEQILASHPRIHTAEGCFYRDILRDAFKIPVFIVPPSSLDASTVGKLAPAPWGKDQKLAALAAWGVME